MSRNMCQTLCALGIVSGILRLPAAEAQWYPAGNPCACVQPVVQPCFQTVPVTEMREVTEVVQRPVYETKYVDQQYVEYEPVVKRRTAQVPTVQYRTVTQMQTVQQNVGCWSTTYQRVPKVAPCQYDPRPGVLGWWNRAGYAIRNSFTPDYRAQRQYNPRTLVRQVPVTRTVAVNGTRQVQWNETQYVARRKTRKVAVQTMRMESRTVTARRPVTVMRTLPIGSQMAFAVGPYNATQSALAPVPDSISAEKENDDRSARRPDSFEQDGKETTIPGRQFRREPVDTSERDSGVRRSSYQVPLKSPSKNSGPAVNRPSTDQITSPPSVAMRTTRIPSIVRVRGWVARSHRSQVPVIGPELGSPAVSVARNER